MIALFHRPKNTTAVKLRSRGGRLVTQCLADAQQAMEAELQKAEQALPELCAALEASFAEGEDGAKAAPLAGRVCELLGFREGRGYDVAYSLCALIEEVGERRWAGTDRQLARLHVHALTLDGRNQEVTLEQLKAARRFLAERRPH